MQIQKTKLAIAIGSLGLFMGAAQVANAGVVELAMPDAGSPTALVPTFSTDISGPGSANQAFYAADVYWTPEEHIAGNSSVRFNLGGQDGNPAKFTTNGIDVNNFVFVASVGIDAWTANPTLAAAGGATIAATASELTSILVAAGTDARSSTSAQLLTAINAAAAAAENANVVLVGAALLNTADNAAEMAAAAEAALAVGDQGKNIGQSIANALIATAASYNSFPATQGLTNRVAASSYTNGDAATWFTSAGLGYGRIFTTTTAGGVGQFDVTVTVKPNIVGDLDGKTGGITGDSILLSLNSGKYVNGDSTLRTFTQTANPDTRVDVTNLLAQGFDGSDVAGYADKGKINIYVSVQQGGLTRDQKGNSALYAASAQPLKFYGYIGNGGQTGADDVATTINLAADEKLFSPNGIVTAWYNNSLATAANSKKYNHLGSFKFEIGAVTGISYNVRGAGVAEAKTQVSDPNGRVYALTADDKLEVSVRSNEEASSSAIKQDGFTPLTSMFLRAGANADCTAAVANNDFALAVNASEIAGTPVIAKGSRAFAQSALTAGTFYTVCAHTDGSKELTTLTGTVSAKLLNIEPTYQDPTLDLVTIGTWGRNGCDATFFNVPGNGPDAAGIDRAFLRFTNTTGDKDNAGSVRVKVYGQDGEEKGVPGRIMATAGSAGLAGSLKGHQTGVYNAHDVARAVGLGSLATDRSVNVFPNERVRVVMSGGFATCEGQNMIATGKDGIATNVTATTNANTNSDNARPGFNGNNSN